MFNRKCVTFCSDTFKGGTTQKVAQLARLGSLRHLLLQLFCATASLSVTYNLILIFHLVGDLCLGGCLAPAGDVGTVKDPENIPDDSKILWKFCWNLNIKAKIGTF